MSPSTVTVNLAGHEVGQMGFGLMQLTWNPTPPDEETSLAAMKQAADSGALAWSTATFYGNPGDPYANCKLIGRFFKKYPEYKDKVVIVLKGGAEVLTHYTTKVDDNRQFLQKAAEHMGKRPEIYSLARLHLDQSFEDVFKGMKTLLDEGLFGAFGASELRRETLDKANKIIPISYVELEVSLWSYDQSIRDAIEWSKENKVPILCYSPLGRGFITRKWKSPEDVPEGSFQKMVPRFQGQAFYDNLRIVDELDRIAKEKGLETSQLALAWVISLSPYNIPIPGSSNATRVRQNTEAANIKLTSEDLKVINEILDKFEVSGERYPGPAQAQLMQ